MYKLKKIIKNNQKVLLLLIAGGCSSLFQWLFICTMTKMFDVAIVGIYSGAAAIITPIVTFANMSLRSMQVTDVNGLFDIKNAFAIKKIALLFAGIICCVIFGIKDEPFLIGVYSLQLLILSFKLVNMLSDGAYGYLIRNGMTLKYTISITVIHIGSFVLFLIGALFSHDIHISMILYALPYFIVFITYDLKNVGGKEVWKHRISKTDFKAIIHLCLPLAIVQTINTLYDSIPKLVLEANYGNSELGVFSAITYVSLTGGLVVTAITTGYATELAVLLKKERYRNFFIVVIKEILAVCIVCISFIALFAIWGEPILTLLYSRVFIKYKRVVLVLIIAMSLNFISRVLGTACTAAQYNNNQLVTAAVCVGFLAVLSFAFIPKYGIMAAAIVECGAYLLKILILSGVLGWNLIFRENNKLNM